MRDIYLKTFILFSLMSQVHGLNVFSLLLSLYFLFVFSKNEQKDNTTFMGKLKIWLTLKTIKHFLVKELIE